MALDISTARSDIAKVYIAAFNRAPDASGLDFWTKAYMGGSSLASIANGFASSTEYANKYPSFLTNTEYVKAIYTNVFGRTVDTAGSAYWTSALDAGTLTKATLLNALVSAATSSATNTDGMRLNNMADFGVYAASNGISQTATNSALISITSDSATLDAAKTAVGTFNTSYALTTSKDAVYGTINNDTFTGSLDGNSNTLNSGDQIHGGSGTDTLSVTLGNASNFAILATTSGIETVKIQAQSTDATGSQGDTDSNAEHVRIDAEDMSGVSKWTNVDSRATLDIEDVRINSHITTLEWNNADQGSNVDYNVYFNPTNITGPGSNPTGSSLTIRMANALTIKEGGNPLSGFTAVDFYIDSTKISVDVSTITSYSGLVTAINSAITAAGISNVTASAPSTEKTVFSIPVKTYATGEEAGTYYPIVITSSGSAILKEGTMTLAQGGNDGNIAKTQTPTEATTVPSLTQVDVILDNVGRGSKSGDFLAGNMSTGTYSGSKGIEQFNVTVENNSKLATMSSTNNTLEVVNVENGTTKGSLSLTGGSTTNATYGLTDVRVFDAHQTEKEMEGAITLTAELTAATTTKYLKLVDTATDASADNSEIAYTDVTDIQFSYDMGKGNDTLTLDISGSNLNTTGGTTTREDFVMVVNGNEGDDKLNLKIVNATNDTATPTGSATNWYNNHDLTKNITVNGGDGADTIKTYGVGDITINGDAGNDVVYADNTGVKATWVLNTTDQVTAASASRTQDDLRSDNNNTYGTKLTATTAASTLAGSNLTVSFKGLTSTVAVKYDATAYTTSDLQINQTIKEAINSDAVLNKLLLAQDGPANTLVITSLIDGEMTTGDLDITVAAPAAGKLTASQISTIGTAFSIASPTEALVLAAIAAGKTAFDAKGDYVDNFTNGAASVAGADNDGGRSFSTSDNTITGGTGDDVIVLGTTFGTDATIIAGTTTSTDDSNDTVVYNAAFGNDTIVHFLTAGAGVDALDFSSLGTATTVAARVVGTNSTQAEVQATLRAADAATTAATANTVYLSVNGNKATVYQVTNGTAVNDLTATEMGTITLAADQVNNGAQALLINTGWTTLLGTYNSGKIGYSGSTYNTGTGTGSTGSTGTGTGGTGTSTASIAVTAAGSVTDTSSVNTTYTVTAGNYTYSIAGFGAGDKIDFPADNTPTVVNSSYTDGSVTLQYANAGVTTLVTLTGLSSANDIAINSITDVNTVFGTGTIF